MNIARRNRTAAVAVVVLALATIGVSGARPPASGAGRLLSARLSSATREAEVGGGTGYWLVTAVGGVYTYGTAKFYGSAAGMHLDSPIVGIVATSDARGYWLVAKDGGVFNFGDAVFAGSLGGSPLNTTVVGMASGNPGAVAGPQGPAGARPSRRPGRDWARSA